MIEQYIKDLDRFLEILTLTNEKGQELTPDRKFVSVEERRELYKRIFPLLSITKFFAFKEEFIYKLEEKSDAQAKPVSKLVFDFSKSKNLIPYMKLILEKSNIVVEKKDPSYRVDIDNINSKIPFDMSEEELKELVWKFNKIRDSLAHIHFELDVENNNIIINNSDPEHNPPDYVVNGGLPLHLLDTTLFLEAKNHNIYDFETYNHYLEFSNTLLHKNDSEIDNMLSENLDFKDNEITVKLGELSQLFYSFTGGAFRVQNADSLDSLYLVALITYANLSLNLFMETLGKNATNDYYSLIDCNFLDNSSIKNSCLESLRVKIEDAFKREPTIRNDVVQGYEKSSFDNFYTNTTKAFEQYEQLDEKGKQKLDITLYSYLKDFLSPLKDRTYSLVSLMRNALDHCSLMFTSDRIFFINYRNYHEQTDKTIISTNPSSLREFIAEINLTREIYLENSHFDQHTQLTRFINLLRSYNPIKKMIGDLKSLSNYNNVEYIDQFMEYLDDIVSLYGYKNPDYILNEEETKVEHKKK